MMKVASWNVNSLKVRLPHVLAWLNKTSCDILALQETKLMDNKFPIDEIEKAGYHVVCSGQKTYNGVALLAKQPIRDVTADIPGLDDPQRRILVASIGDFRVINLYVVNGSEVGSDKYRYKLNWFHKVTQYIAEQKEKYDKLIVMGDFNIAPEDKDVYDPVSWREKILCSTLEREALKKLLAVGFKDVFRCFEQQERSFSWWDYREASFQRNQGLRIDLILVSLSLVDFCQSCDVDIEPRKLARPSDHAPVVATFA